MSSVHKPLDGAGLLCGVLKSLMDRGNGCPRVLVATHFHEIFRHDLLDPETMPITFLHMQVMFASDDGEECTEAGYDVSGDGGPTKSSKRITYLYRSVSYRFPSSQPLLSVTRRRQRCTGIIARISCRAMRTGLRNPPASRQTSRIRDVSVLPGSAKTLPAKNNLTHLQATNIDA
jgi:hypothetical protein